MSERRTLDVNELREIANRFARDVPEIREIRLFGSQHKGIATATSDFDIAVLLDGANDDDIFGMWMDRVSEWRSILSSLINSPVDLQISNPTIAPNVAGYCADSTLLFARLSGGI